MATVQEDLVAGLEGFSGQVLRSADAGYDEARRIHNGLIDKRPAIIARCLGTADVVAAVKWRAIKGWSSRSVEADTTSPARRSPTAASWSTCRS